MENIKVNAQQPPSKKFQVLLILIQHGANDLNLLEAKHIVLVEPLLNLTAEEQAISWLHWIGQENKILGTPFFFFFLLEFHPERYVILFYLQVMIVWYNDL